MKIFDENGSDDISDRKLIGGRPTGISDFNRVKYTWTTPLYRQMVANFWIPEIISVSQDKAMYRSGLSESKKKAFNDTLSFLIFLDSQQTLAIPSFAHLITAPEVRKIFPLQAFQEVVHSQSYAYILESLCSNEESQSILYRFKDDKDLLIRCKQITNHYEAYLNNLDDPEFLKRSSLVSLALEGTLFYNGFYFFYNLANNDEMQKVADEIRLIHRDEETHLIFNGKIISTAISEGAFSYTDEEISEIISPIVDFEIYWCQKTYKDIPGITNKTIEDFTKYRATVSLEMAGLTSPYKNVSNPYAYLEDSTIDRGNIKTALFESRSTGYDQSAITMNNWSDI